MWAVHVAMVWRYKNRRQRYFPVWEDVYIVDASDSLTAVDMALGMAREYEASSRVDHSTLRGQEATEVVAGVRKVNRCFEDAEATHSKFLVDGRENLERFVAGQPVRLLLEE
jgi:hypothetical protein